MVRPLQLLLAALALVALGCKSDGAADGSQLPPAAPADSQEPAVVDAPAPSQPEGDEGGGPSPVDTEIGDVPTTPAPQAWQTNDAREPVSIHMTWQRDPTTTLTLQWSTTENDLEAYKPFVWAVPSSEVEGSGAKAVMPFDKRYVHEGTGEHYKETLGPAAGMTSYVSWTVELEGLDPDTEYTYRAGTWEGYDPGSRLFDAPDLSEPHTFRTAHAKGSREPFSFVMAGDSRGGAEKIREQAQRLAAIDARMWFFNGDMTDYGTHKEWAQWFDAMGPILRHRVLMPVQGNHEIFAAVYYAQFALPREPDLDESYQEQAWSFDYGNTHFVGLQSLNEAAAKAQAGWLDKDLAAARADADIDWIVVMLHHAAYSASSHGSTPHVREHWVPIFDKHRVDLVVAGHDHNYERTKPIRENKVVEPGEGVVYVVAGAFYSPGYGNGNEWWTAVSHHGDKGNYVVLEVEAKSLSLTAYSGDGKEILDRLDIAK
jgi:hypothetical protein